MSKKDQLKKAEILERLYSVENFALAFMRQRSSNSYARIQVSMSRDGVTWHDTGFPDLKVVKVKDTSGVGICGSPDGRNLTVIFNDKKGAIHVVEGFVTGNSVSWNTPSKKISMNSTDSAPSCTYIRGGIRLVAFRSGKKMKVYVYTGGNTFIGETWPPLFNQNSLGRPTITRIQDNIMMSWQQYDETARCTNIILAQGQAIQEGAYSTFSFLDHHSGILRLAESNVLPCATNNPVLATDDKCFYLAIIQRRRGGGAGTLSFWEVILYKSNGNDIYSGWKEHDRIPLNVHNQTYVNLAAKQDGTLIAAKLLDSARGDNEYETKLFANNSWQEDIGGAPWLNAPGAGYRHFSLTRFGVDAPMKLMPKIQGLKTIQDLTDIS